MSLENYKKCGINYFTMRILPLTDEQKEYLLKQDKNQLKNCSEYNKLLGLIYEYKNSYHLAPLVNRYNLKQSYVKEFNEAYSAFAKSQELNNTKTNEITK